MAIGDLGERLSKSAAAKHRKDRKDRESWETRVAVGSLLGPAAVSLIGEVGKSVLTATQSTFLNSEAVQAERARNASALRKVESIYKTERDMEESGIGGVMYLYDKIKPVAHDALDAITVEAQEGRHITSDNIMSETWNEVVDLNSMEIAKEQFAAHKDNLVAADKVVSMEQFDSMLASQLKDVTPTTLSGAVTRWVANKYTGKTNEGRQQAVLEDIRQHHYLESASSLERFDEAYKLTKNVRTARDWAALGDSIAEYVSTEHVSHNAPGSQMMTVGDKPQLIRWDQEVYDNGEVGPRIYKEPEDIPGLEDPVFTRQQEIAYKNSLISQWDPVKDVISLIGEDNYVGYIKVLLEEETVTRNIGDNKTEVILPNRIENGEEWRQIVDHFNTYITDHPELVISADEKYLRSAMLNAYTGTDVFAQAADDLEKSGYYEMRGTPEFRKSLNYYLNLRSEGGVAGEKPDDYVEKYLPAIDQYYRFQGALEDIGNIRRRTLQENPPSTLTTQEDDSDADTSDAGAGPTVAQVRASQSMVGATLTERQQTEKLISETDLAIKGWLEYRENLDPVRGVGGRLTQEFLGERDEVNKIISDLRSARGKLAGGNTVDDVEDWLAESFGKEAWSKSFGDIWDWVSNGPETRARLAEQSASEEARLDILRENRPDFVPPVQVASVDDNIPK